MVRWQLTNPAYLDRYFEKTFFLLYIFVKLHLISNLRLFLYFESSRLSFVFSSFYIHYFLGFLTHSFLVSGNFCNLLITFANSLFPDQYRQNDGPDLDTDPLTR